MILGQLAVTEQKHLPERVAVFAGDTGEHKEWSVCPQSYGAMTLEGCQSRIELATVPEHHGHIVCAADEVGLIARRLRGRWPTCD